MERWTGALSCFCFALTTWPRIRISIRKYVLEWVCSSMQSCFVHWAIIVGAVQWDFEWGARRGNSRRSTPLTCFVSHVHAPEGWLVNLTVRCRQNYSTFRLDCKFPSKNLSCFGAFLVEPSSRARLIGGQPSAMTGWTRKVEKKWERNWDESEVMCCYRAIFSEGQILMTARTKWVPQNCNFHRSKWRKPQCVWIILLQPCEMPLLNLC